MNFGASRLGFWYRRQQGGLIGALTSACDYFPSVTRASLYATYGTPSAITRVVDNNYIRYAINGTNEGTIGSGQLSYSGQDLLGLRYDPAGTGTYVKEKDYISPGISWEAFKVQVQDDTPSATINVIGGSNTDYPASVFPADALMWEIGGSDRHHIVIKGSASTGYVIIQYMTVGSEPIIRMKMTYENTTAYTQYVKMMRAVDPDPDNYSGGSPNTINTRGQGTIPATDLVLSAGSISGYPLALYVPGNGYTHTTTITNAVGAVNGWPQYDIDFLLTGYDGGNGDKAIAAAWDIGNVLPGESASVCCYYICSYDVPSLTGGL